MDAKTMSLDAPLRREQ